MKSFTLARKPYEAPEAEALIINLEPICLNPSEVTQNSITKMEQWEDL